MYSLAKRMSSDQRGYSMLTTKSHAGILYKSMQSSRKGCCQNDQNCSVFAPPMVRRNASINAIVLVISLLLIAQVGNRVVPRLVRCM
jgi:hypothetical protein